MKRNTDTVKDKIWCEEQYITLGKSLRQIRSETGLGINTLKRWLKKHGIETRQVDKIVRSQMSHKLFDNPKWKGKYNNAGYSYIYNPSHPNASPSGYISEHRFIAEGLIGRVLNIDEFVHHIDMDKKNNNINNLHISKQRAHKNIHASFNRLCRELILRGIVIFDKENECYGLQT